MDLGNQLRRQLTQFRAGLAPFVFAAVMVISLGGFHTYALAAETPGQSGEAQPDSAGRGDAITQFFHSALDTLDFKPLWRSGNWSTAHASLHIAADLTISAVYLLIPIILFHFMRKSPGAGYSGLFWLFVAFISAAAIVHLLDALMFWWPAYRLTGLVKAGTCMISLITAVVLIRVIPRAMTFRSPVELQSEIVQRAGPSGN